MGKEVKKVEFKDFLDTKGLSEDESKVFEVFSKGLDGYMEALFASTGLQIGNLSMNA